MMYNQPPTGKGLGTNPATEGQSTPVIASSLIRQANEQPIPGYRLIERIGKGGYGEVWKCEAPGGLFKAIKFVFGELGSIGDNSATAEQELQSLQRVKLIRHPFLLSVERVEIIRDQLIIVTELADRNLLEVRNEYQMSGLPGVPRQELLSYLREAAEALDWMNLQFGLQHLDIKPQNLFLVSNHIKVADFGLVASLWETKSDTSLIAGTTPAYCPPEVYRGSISPMSDQYSLAIVYQEQLTGKRPFQGKTARQLAMLHDKAEPDLSALPVADRPIVARALCKDARQRFATCLAFINALRKLQRSPFTSLQPLGKTDPNRAYPGFKDGLDAVSPTQQALPSFAPTVMGTNGRLGKSAIAAESSQGLEDAAPAVGEFQAGLKFLACLDHSLLSEVWKVQTPDGNQKAAKFIHGFARTYIHGEKEAVARLAQLQHSGLLRFEVAYHRPGRLIIVSNLGGQTLLDRLQECRLQGMAALPRWELLACLKSAGETLDHLRQHHSLQHLCLNPSNLICLDEQYLVADAGLMHLLWLPAGHSPFQLNALYSAPELFDRQIHPSCDSYSLAMIYLEMLTGQHPHLGLTLKHLAAIRSEGPPDLSMLPESDQRILARALDPDPARRFESCVELIGALRESTAGERPLLRGLPPVVSSTWSFLPAGLSGPVPSAEEIITKLMEAATPDNREDAVTFASSNGHILHCQFSTELAVERMREKLDAFFRQWHAQIVCCDSDFFLCRVGLPRGFFQRYLARPLGLELHAQMNGSEKAGAKKIEVQVRVKPYGGKPGQADQVIRELAPALIRSLRDHFLTKPEQRGGRRHIIYRPVRVFPVLHNFQLGQPLQCKAKDVSLTGLGFLAPQEPSTQQVYVDANIDDRNAMLGILAQIARISLRDDGWFEVGASFSISPPI
jgi:serine/threonine protein kinase